jgi:hypothetical protein
MLLARRSEIHHIIFHLPYGKERRVRLLEYIRSTESKCMWVNGRYQVQVKQDTDLKYLLKKGILKQCRTEAWGNKRQTYLMLS